MRHLRQHSLPLLLKRHLNQQLRKRPPLWRQSALLSQKLLLHPASTPLAYLTSHRRAHLPALLTLFAPSMEMHACATGGGEVNPFVLWEFLNALEQSGSAVRQAAVAQLPGTDSRHG